MRESTFTIRVDDHLKEGFTEAAREKAEYEEWFKARVEAGLKAIQEGRVLSNDAARERSGLRRERLLADHAARFGVQAMSYLGKGR